VRAIIAEFIARYSTEWLIERLGHRPPGHARAEAGGPHEPLVALDRETDGPVMFSNTVVLGRLHLPSLSTDRW
jgi:hypothetical protein